MVDLDDGFEQDRAGRAKLGDYNLGIGDSWVKAITEIITNSHQNYHQYWDKLGLDKEKGNPAIIIIADPHRETFTTVDYGTGIANDIKDLKRLIGKYSRFIKESHTVKGRSSFARGMSDVLFRTGKYRNLILSHKDGKCVAIDAYWKEKEDGDQAPVFWPNKKVTESQILAELPKHGTRITFNWSNQHEKRKFPSKKEMLDSLQKYYELKNLLNDEKVDVLLYYLDSKEKPQPVKLEFINYHKNAEQVGKTLSEIPLAIDTSDLEGEYNIRIISARMLRAKNVILNQSRGEERTGGLFVEGEHKQVYDLTLFEQERNYRDASLRMIGEVVLSEDAKRYMDDYYTKHGTPILTRTREGFDTRYGFYKELKKKLEPWLVGILESESQSSMAPKTDKFDKGIKKLNEIAMKMLETKNLETGEDIGETGGDDKGPVLPDTIAFSPESANVEQGERSRLSLKINCEKINPGTRVLFRKAGLDSAHFDVEWDTVRVPKPNKYGLAKIPIYVKCNEIDATAEIVAQTKKKNDEKTVEKYCFLKCVDPQLPPEDPLTEYLEFIPKKTTVETNVNKQINLWAHQILDPGTKIMVKFACETHDFEPPITFENDGRQKVETGTHSFEIEVPDTPLEPNAYRKIPIIFTGTGEGLRGKITADSAHKKVIPTTCEIEIENTSKGGGLLSGWEIINSSYDKYAWYEPDPICKVQINIGVPFVRKILGNSKDEVDVRCDKLPEAQVFVAHTIMDTFLDEIITRMFEARKLRFGEANPSYRASHEDMVFQKQYHMKEHGKEILDEFAPNIRVKTSGGNVHQMNFKKEDIGFRFWDLELQQNIIPPISFNQLEEFRGKPANMTPIHFEVKGQTFEIGVYEVAGKFVVRMHNYDKDGKYKSVMPDIDNIEQIFRPPKQVCKKVSLVDPVFSAVKITGWVKQPDKNKRLIHEHIDYDQYDKIIEPPELNHANHLLESSSNWLSSDGDSLIQYAKYSDIDQSHANDNMMDKLACFVSSRNTMQMAKMFVRTKVVPAFVQFNDLVKTFKDVIAECEDAKCGERAEGYEQILTKIGFHREGENMVINKLCRNCQ